jgi:hypothetical protein
VPEVDDLKSWERKMNKAKLELAEAEEEAVKATTRLVQTRELHDAYASIVAGLRRLRNVALQEAAPGGLDDGGIVVAKVTPTGHEGDAPRGREAALRVLRENPRAWTPPELAAEIDRRGWIKQGAKNAVAAARVTLRRLEADGLVEKVGTGYRARPVADVLTNVGTNQQVLEEVVR